MAKLHPKNGQRLLFSYPKPFTITFPNTSLCLAVAPNPMALTSARQRLDLGSTPGWADPRATDEGFQGIPNIG